MPWRSVEKWGEASKGQELLRWKRFSFPSLHTQNKTECQHAKPWKLQNHSSSSLATYNLLPILKQRSKGTPSSIYIQFLIAWWLICKGMKSSQGKPKQSEVTLTQCHKGYEEEAGRSCKWLSSIKSSNKRIMEFPLTVNLKMLEVGKI